MLMSAVWWMGWIRKSGRVEAVDKVDVDVCGVVDEKPKGRETTAKPTCNLGDTIPEITT